MADSERLTTVENHPTTATGVEPGLYAGRTCSVPGNRNPLDALAGGSASGATGRRYFGAGEPAGRSSQPISES